MDMDNTCSSRPITEFEQLKKENNNLKKKNTDLIERLRELELYVEESMNKFKCIKYIVK